MMNLPLMGALYPYFSTKSDNFCPDTASMSSYFKFTDTDAYLFAGRGEARVASAIERD